MKKIKNLFKENDRVKFVVIAILVTLILTWIIPGGSFSGTKFTKADITRIGLNELSISGVYALSFFLQQIAFVLVLGAFYGIISLTNGYKELVSRCAKFVKGKEIPIALIISALIAIYVSISSQMYISFVAIPFIITVLLRAGFNKLSAFTTTFGSVLVGIIGATYGTEGLYYFNMYMNAKVADTAVSRISILVVTYVLFNAFNVLYIKKNIVKGKNNIDETKDDKFAVEESSKKKVKVWPIIVLLAIVAIFAILGYVKWSENFDIKVFEDFHKWLTELTIGKHTIISYILGKVTAFGTWEIISMILVLFIVAIISAIVYKISIDDVIEGATNGLSKMIKPVLLMVLAYSIFVIVYWSPIVPTIANWILKTKFNSFSAAGTALVSSLFTADFGYTGYTIGQYLSAAYTKNIKEIFVIFPAMHGFVQMIAPTSVILLAGLSYTDVSYKEWIKYIWKFALALLLILLIIFAL